MSLPNGIGERRKDDPSVDETDEGEGDNEMKKTELRHDDSCDRDGEKKTTEESRSKKDEFKGIAKLALAIVAVLKPSFPQRSPEGKQFLLAQVTNSLAPTRSHVPSEIRITSLPEAGSVPGPQ